MLIATAKYRLYPTRAQETALCRTLEICRSVYNSLVHDRIVRYESTGKGPSFFDQSAYMAQWKKTHPELSEVYSHILISVCKRVDLAFAAFFQRVKRGDTPGFPQLKKRGQYNSFTYPQEERGYHVNEGDKPTVTLGKVGAVSIVFHRPLPGKAKTCTVVCQSGKWFACFACECEEAEALPQTGKAVGVDVGVCKFATLSNGSVIENARYFASDKKQLSRARRQVSEAKKGSLERVKALRKLAHIHERIRNRRKDFLHKQSRQLVNECDTIAVEDLQVSNMTRKPQPKESPEQAGHYLPNGASAKAGLNRSILDAGWYQFRLMLAYKSEWGKRRFVAVVPHFTSQDCSGCGERVQKSLSVRTHSCPSCGLVLDRDENAAKNILAKALLN